MIKSLNFTENYGDNITVRYRYNYFINNKMSPFEQQCYYLFSLTVLKVTICDSSNYLGKLNLF